MPVIGRLDKQVDDVLITPVGNKSSRDDGDAGTRDDERERARGESHTLEHDEGERVERARDDLQRRDDESLPVWLL
jgi:hypothetical protein